MATSGRKRKPMALRVLENGQSVPLAPVSVRGGPPKCPRWLNKEARVQWRHLVRLLDDLGLLAQTDAGILAAYCETYVAWRRAQQVIDEHGVSYVTPSGRYSARPEAAMVKALLVELRALAGELGLSPASRARLAIPQASVGDTSSPFDI